LLVPQLEVELLGLQERLESGSHPAGLLQLDIHSVHKVLHNEGPTPILAVQASAARTVSESRLYQKKREVRGSGHGLVREDGNAGVLIGRLDYFPCLGAGFAGLLDAGPC
jgi:hypothetical protein